MNTQFQQKRYSWRSALIVLVVLATFVPCASGQQTEAIFRQDAPEHTLYLPMIMRSFPLPPPIFGVFMKSITDSGGLQEALDARAHWVDFNVFSWAILEPEQGNYQWQTVDEQSLINANEAGLEVVARVHHTPRWARELPDHYGSRIDEPYFDDFADFLTVLVNRYKDYVTYWQLDNEVDVDPSIPNPENSIFWCWGDKDDPYYGGGYFAQMLKHAYPAIKAADPQAKVVIGGLLMDCDPNNPPPDPENPQREKNCTSSKFLEGILRGGGGDYFDAVSFHSYAYFRGSLGKMSNGNWTGGDWDIQTTAIPEKANFLWNVLEAYGYGHKQLMNMEAALFCTEVWTSAQLKACFETQAMYIPRAYAEALALDLTAQAWFLMKEPSWRKTGLLNEDLTLKPAYEAYKTASFFLTGTQYVKPATRYQEQGQNIEGYTFKTRDHKNHIDVIWSADGSTHEITISKGATAYDRYNNILSETIEIGYSPVYIVRP